MTNLSISQLPAAGALAGTELVELVQSGDSVKSTALAVANTGITQVITNGVTNKAPSEDAVFDALANKQAVDAQLTSLAALSYAGNSLKVVRLNAGETDFEFATVTGFDNTFTADVNALDHGIYDLSYLKLNNNVSLYFRNASDDADIPVLKLDNGDELFIGSASVNKINISSNIETAGKKIEDVGAIGTRNNNKLYTKNAADDAVIDLILANASNIVVIGDNDFPSLYAGLSHTFYGVDSISIPSGQTADRSGSPVEGMIRYNTDIDQIEGYAASQWAGIVGAFSIAPSNIVPSGSPFLFTNADTYPQDVIISGGTVTLIEFSRDEMTFFDAGIIAGIVNLSPGDSVQVTYSVAPTMTKVPR